MSTMIIYTEVSITPSHSGFGMFERGELQIGQETSWAVLSDLLFEIGQNSEIVLPLHQAIEDENFMALGVEDISGNLPSRLFARINNHGELCYFGIEESEVSEDFFTA